MVLQVIEERAAIGSPIERPADGVHDQARLVPGRIDLPELLEADPVGLGIDAVAQVEVALELLGERAAAALGEQRVSGVQLDPGLVVGLGLAVAVEAHGAGRHALDAAVVVGQDLGGGEAGIDLGAELARPARRATSRRCPC